jgi:rhodanese-related sulfurtransferase
MKNLTPKEAWAYIQTEPEALFVDVRMEIESMYVGRPPGVVHVSWYEYPDLEPDAALFVRRVEEEAGDKTRPVVLICRSGKRTVDAALALKAAGFENVTNVLHGFEGDLDDSFHRSTLNGWRFDGLPWEQM